AEALGARRDGDGFVVELADGRELRALRLVLATGVVDACPDIEGFAEHYGASAFHCPACDGYDAEDRSVGAYGWDERLVGFAASTRRGTSRSTPTGAPASTASTRPATSPPACSSCRSPRRRARRQGSRPPDRCTARTALRCRRRRPRTRLGRPTPHGPDQPKR